MAMRHAPVVPYAEADDLMSAQATRVDIYYSQATL